MSEKTKELITCGDNSCLLDKPTGMATNGGCRCINRNMTTGETLRVKQFIHRERQRMAELEKQLEKAESNNRFKQHTKERFKQRVDELEELIIQLASARGTIHINDVDLWNRVRHEAESIKEQEAEGK